MALEGKGDDFDAGNDEVATRDRSKPTVRATDGNEVQGKVLVLKADSYRRANYVRRDGPRWMGSANESKRRCKVSDEKTPAQRKMEARAACRVCSRRWFARSASSLASQKEIS